MRWPGIHSKNDRTPRTRKPKHLTQAVKYLSPMTTPKPSPTPSVHQSKMSHYPRHTHLTHRPQGPPYLRAQNEIKQLKRKLHKPSQGKLQIYAPQQRANAVCSNRRSWPTRTTRSSKSSPQTHSSSAVNQKSLLRTPKRSYNILRIGRSSAQSLALTTHTHGIGVTTQRQKNPNSPNTKQD